MHSLLLFHLFLFSLRVLAYEVGSMGVPGGVTRLRIRSSALYAPDRSAPISFDGHGWEYLVFYGTGFAADDREQNAVGKDGW